jgi:hypothetical protein
MSKVKFVRETIPGLFGDICYSCTLNETMLIWVKYIVCKLYISSMPLFIFQYLLCTKKKFVRQEYFAIKNSNILKP